MTDPMTPLDQIRNHEKPCNWKQEEWQEAIDALLAAERRATVERIRTQVNLLSGPLEKHWIMTILDEELRTADDSAKAAR